LLHLFTLSRQSCICLHHFGVVTYAPRCKESSIYSLYICNSLPEDSSSEWRGSLGLKRPGREADHSLPQSTDFYAWSYTSTPPYVLRTWHDFTFMYVSISKYFELFNYAFAKVYKEKLSLLLTKYNTMKT
jgi:hypothetical protein